MSTGEPPPADFPFIPRENVHRVAVICHRHADPDSYLSAYALSYLVRKISPGATVDLILPEGMSVLTQKLAESFPHPGETSGGTDYDLLVAVDTGHAELLKDWQERLRATNGMKVLVDHHPIQEDGLYDRLIVDPSATAAAQVVSSLFNRLGVKPDEKTAQALIIAILFDSQHLMIASVNTLKEVVHLIDCGADLESARSSLRSPPDYGEVIAKLKAARRAKLYNIAGWVVVTSTVGSFQANVARSLVSMGADVAIVAGDVQDETRVSLRANPRFKDATKVHLGTDIAEVVSKGTGYGGGHPTASSFTCTLGEEKAIENSLDLLARLLNEKPTEIR